MVSTATVFLIIEYETASGLSIPAKPSHQMILDLVPQIECNTLANLSLAPSGSPEGHIFIAR